MMSKELQSNLKLYQGQEVRVTTNVGRVEEGELKEVFEREIRVNGVGVLFHALSDVKLKGVVSGPVDEKGQLRVKGSSRSDYRLNAAQCGEASGFRFEDYMYGERTAEILCHLVLEEDRVVVKDVELVRNRYELNRELLEGKEYLYQLGRGGWIPARLIWDGDRILMRRYSDANKRDVDTAISPEDIADVTKCPMGGSGDRPDEVLARLKDGTEREGIVLSAMNDRFVLRDRRDITTEIRYSDLASLRYKGTLDRERSVYNGKYRCVRTERALPFRASFVVGVAPEGYVAKQIQRDLDDVRETYGLTVVYSPDKGQGYISTEFNRAEGKKQGNILFRDKDLTFQIEPGIFYAVRCAYWEEDGKREAVSVEALEGKSWSIQEGQSKVFTIDQTGEVQIREMTDEERAQLDRKDRSPVTDQWKLHQELLQERKGLSADSPEYAACNRKLIECNAALLAVVPDHGTRMELLREQADCYFSLRNYAAARRAYEQWKDAYQVLLSMVPKVSAPCP